MAAALDCQAEARQSNQLLIQAIATYGQALAAPTITAELYRRAALRLVDRLRFKGAHLQAVPVHNGLIARFPDNSSYQNELAVTYLMINRLTDARPVLERVLKAWPDDGLGHALYGLLLKMQGELAAAIPHLQAGIRSGAEGTRDARFYLPLGEALGRLGQRIEADQVHELGVALGLFRSRYQRSLYNVDRLTARPWWTHEQTTYTVFLKKLEENWETIRDEGLSVMRAKAGFTDEAESLTDIGDWKQFEIFSRGIKSESNCRRVPVTCGLVGGMEAAGGCRRGQTKFSVMSGGTHVHPHCGPTNCRLRIHLGLVVPPGEASLRVAADTRYWREGKAMVFDDSFEHEVWHNGTSERIVLIVDVWHPELTDSEKKSLSAI